MFRYKFKLIYFLNVLTLFHLKPNHRKPKYFFIIVLKNKNFVTWLKEKKTSLLNSQKCLKKCVNKISDDLTIQLRLDKIIFQRIVHQSYSKDTRNKTKIIHVYFIEWIVLNLFIKQNTISKVQAKWQHLD